MSDFVSPEPGILFDDQAEQSIVGSHKELLTGMNHQWLALGSDTGINDCDVDSPGRKACLTGQEHIGRRDNVLRRYLVRNIDTDSRRIPTENHSFHRRNEIVRLTEIREQGDNWRGHV